VKILINTHAHFDHAGGLAQLKADIPTAKVWASRAGRAGPGEGPALRRQRQRPDAVPAVKVDKGFGDEARS
jgi:metallo-beta-lactamase class B